MIKAELISVAFVTIVSGCAFVDSPPTQLKTTEQSAPRAALEPVSSPSDPETPSVMAAPAVIRRSFTSDDIRRIQVRMRDVGLAPGPVDGIAGGKTIAALNRFQLGCAQINGLLEVSEGSMSQGVSFNRVPRRRETLAIQTRLREAGFNPGPVDGIFGPKMKNILSHLQNGCPVVPEFIAFLDQPGDAGDGEPSPAVRSAGEASRVANPPVRKRRQLAKPRVTPIEARADDAVLALQLRLRDAGYDPGPLDGIMGPKTKLALHQMQANRRNHDGGGVLATGFGTEY